LTCCVEQKVVARWPQHPSLDQLAEMEGHELGGAGNRLIRAKRILDNLKETDPCIYGFRV